MATIANVIKWVSNIEEFRAQMKSGVDQVVAMESAVEKTVRSLGGEGLIRSANNAAAAVEKLGGTSKLTAGESERLAGMMDKAITKYAALGQTAPSALQRLLDATRANVEQSKKLADETAAVQRNVQAFSGAKVISEAGAMAKAVEQFGGANKLTATEQANVNRVLSDAIAKYQALGQVAPKALRDLEQQTRQLPPAQDSAGLSFGKLVGAYVTGQAAIGLVKRGVGELKDFLLSSVDSYAAAEAAQKKLTAALISQGQATPEVLSQYDALATKFQRTTVYSDDLTNEMQALLVQVGQVMPSQMEAALQASTDLASGLGVDLRDATMLVAKAFSGGGDELGRLKSILGDAYVAGKGMDGILAAINEKFGGQAQAEIESYAGKVKQLANEWDNVKEAIGKSIVQDPILNAALSELKDSVQGAGDASAHAAPSFVELWASFVGVDDITLSVIRLTEAMVGWYQVVLHPPKAPDMMKAVSLRPEDVFNAPTAQFGQHPLDVKKYLDDEEAAQKKATAAALAHAAAIKSLADNYSGLSVIKTANDALAAVHQNLRAGISISKMTIEQQNALNDVVKAAIKVYEAEGRIVPLELRKIFDETRHLRTEMEQLALIKINPVSRTQLPVNLSGDTAASQIPLIPRSSLISDIGLPTEIPGLDKLIIQTKDEAAATEKLRLEQERAAKQNHAYADSLDVISQAFSTLSQLGGGGKARAIFQGASSIAAGLSDADRSYTKFADGVQKNTGIATAMFSRTSTTAQKWASGVQSAGVIVGGAMSAWAASANDGSKAAGAFHGAMEGAKAGAMFGPWGMAIGAAAGAVIGFVHTLSAGRRAVKDFAKSFDTEATGSGFDELRTKLLVLGGEGERLWIKLTQGTKKGDKAGAQKVIDEITKSLEAAKQKDAQFNTTLGQTLSQIQKWGGGVGGALRPYLDGLAKAGRLTQENIDLLGTMTDDGKVSWQQLEEAVGRYGGDLSKLGGSFQEARMHESWQQIIDDMDLFQRGGVSSADALDLMKGKISDLVNQSVRFGTEIPANMKPWVEQLIASGKLVDDDGKKITDIGKLKFGETLQTSLQNLNDTLKTLIETFQKVPGAVAAIPREVTTTVTTRYRATYDTTGAPNDDTSSPASTGGYVGMRKILPFTGGGIVPDYFANGTLGRLINFLPKGTDTVPAMLTPGEIVLNAAQQHHVAGAIKGGGDTVNVSVTFNVNAIDRAGVREFLYDEAIPELEKAIRSNVGDLRTTIREVAA
jgi:hypothetical protein